MWTKKLGIQLSAKVGKDWENPLQLNSVAVHKNSTVNN